MAAPEGYRCTLTVSAMEGEGECQGWLRIPG